MSRDWPLVGRAEELRFIDAAVSGSSDHNGIVLAGSAGVGKTRLARETLARARRKRQLTRWVAATSSARALPLGAFAGVWKGSGGDPLRLLREVMDALLEGSEGPGVVVVVDDAHLLDEHSAFLVYQLAMQDLATVVLTVRSGEPAPDSVTALWKDGQLARLELQSLSAEETATLLGCVLDGPIEGTASQRMWSLTRGNVLYLRHVLDEELAADRWRLIDGVWQWIGEPGVSPGLAELIDAQMGGLSESVSAVLDLLAVGEPLAISLLGRLVDPSAIEMAETDGLVSITRSGAILEARLAHPLYGEVRRARTGQLRGRRLRGLLAQGLGASGAERAEDTLRRAVLTLDSDLPPDPAVFTEGARAASELLDVPLAEKLLAAAVVSGGGRDAQVAHAYALSMLSRGEETETILASLVDLESDDLARMQLTVVRACNLFWDLGRPDQAEAILDRARATLTDADALDALDAIGSTFRCLLGRSNAATRTARRVLDSPRLDDRVAIMATIGLVVALGCRGSADEVIAVAARGYAIAERSVSAAFLRFGLCDAHLVALRLAGYLSEANDIAMHLRHANAELPGMPQLTTAVLAGHAAFGAGDLPAARQWLQQAVNGFIAANETIGWTFHALLSLTQTLAMTGERDAAAQALEQLEQRRCPAFGFLEADVLLAHAWVAAAQGTVSKAVQLAATAAETAVALGQPAYEVLALQTAARFGDRTVADRLAELATQVDGPRAPTAAAHAAALAADDGDALHAASQRLEQMGDRLAAADAAAHAATAHARQGRRGPALTAGATAERLAAACGGARTPALREAFQPSPLTTREREIVTLAAQGMSNRAIAERLVVSVRTVEGHMYRAAAKLGGASRAEFGDFLSLGPRLPAARPAHSTADPG